MPATVSGAIYFISSLSPAGTASAPEPAAAPAAASESWVASTERSLVAKPAASSADTAARKWARSGNEATASRTVGAEGEAPDMPILSFVLARPA